MTTCYTIDIEKGISFRDYALKCISAFVRDWTFPNRIEVSDYNQNCINELTKNIDVINNMSDLELDVKAHEQYKSDVDYVERLKQKNLSLKLKYENMLDKVKEYQSPSTNHDVFKEFMISQIQSSIDCDFNYNYNDKIIKKSGEEWKKQQIESLTNDIEYHTKKHKKEVESARTTNEWLDKILESLKE